MSARNFITVAGVVLTGALSTSCFAITDLDRFEGARSAGNFTSLRLTVRGMTSHVAEHFEYRVVDNANFLQARGIIVPLGGVSATVFAQFAVPNLNGPFRLDFFADHDGIPGYATGRDPFGDHAWRLQLDDSMLDDSGSTYEVVFDHNQSFTFLNDPEPPREVGKTATLRLRNMGEFLGKRVEARVFAASSKRVVALYRVPVLIEPETVFEVPGMIEPGEVYGVELYTDDGNATPASIRAFRIQLTPEDATDNGLDVTIDPQSGDLTQVTDAPSP